jgi:peptide deformylase
MILDLAYYGDPILRKKAPRIKEITPEIMQLTNDLIETMQHKNGVGIAAPQVKRSVAVFVAQFPDKTHPDKWVPGPIEVFINPKILEVSEECGLHSEGCLSIPGLYADVWRPLKIRVEYTDLQGERLEKEFEDYDARIVLHENDHINGVLFIDRLDKEKRKEVEPELHKIKKQYSTPAAPETR